MKPLNTMTADELAGALDQLADRCSQDEALRLALHREMFRAAEEEWIFEEPESSVP